MAFGDVLAGLAKASHEHQLNLMQMEHENSKAKGNLLASLANNPNYAPEQQEQLLKGALLHYSGDKKASQLFDVNLDNGTIKVPIGVLHAPPQPRYQSAREIAPGQQVNIPSLQFDAPDDGVPSQLALQQPSRAPVIPGDTPLPQPVAPPPEMRSITQPMSLAERDYRAQQQASALQEIKDKPTAAELARIKKEQSDADRLAAQQAEQARHQREMERLAGERDTVAERRATLEEQNKAPATVTTENGTFVWNAQTKSYDLIPGMGSKSRNIDPLSEEGIAAAARKAKATDSAKAAAGGGLTGDALDMLATQFAKTGALPAMGMGNTAAADRRQIYDRAAQLFPKLDVASSKADYDSNKQSLSQLTKGKDAVKAFEGTALKNLDIFLDKAKGIVDSGSPWINTPLRAISSAGLGSSDLAAFNAARQVAINEIAKVTSNPNLTGVLSDTARREVEGFIPENATLKQVYAVAEVLKKDMQNRTGELDEQISAIKSRIGTNTGGVSKAPAAGAATHRYNPATGQIEAVR